MLQLRPRCEHCARPTIERVRSPDRLADKTGRHAVIARRVIAESMSGPSLHEGR